MNGHTALAVAIAGTLGVEAQPARRPSAERDGRVPDAGLTHHTRAIDRVMKGGRFIRLGYTAD